MECRTAAALLQAPKADPSAATRATTAIGDFMRIFGARMPGAMGWPMRRWGTGEQAYGVTVKVSGPPGTGGEFG